MPRTAQVKRDARIGEAEARRDAGIKVHCGSVVLSASNDSVESRVWISAVIAYSVLFILFSLLMNTRVMSVLCILIILFKNYIF